MPGWRKFESSDMPIALVGEAYGEHEERQRMPFVGPAGYELNRMLDEAGIRRADCLVTNVFNLRPQPKNDVENLCVPKSMDQSGLPSLRNGKYLDARYLPELERLRTELREFQPTCIVALGGTASWALLHDSRISRIRGTTASSAAPAGFKVLPTYHPAAVLRQWDLRPVTVLDLAKARRESEFPEVRRPARVIWTDPTLRDIEAFYHDHILPARSLAFDIETAGDQITCIGFAPRVDLALVVPFVDHRRGGSYWGSSVDERLAWGWVAKILDSPLRKITQNGLYDVHFLWRKYGISVANWTDDTMLLHHALFPESEKGLGFLGSVYTNEPSWKLMRSKAKHTIKQGDDE